MKTKISELLVPGLNTQVMAERIATQLGSEAITDFLLVLQEDSQKIKKVPGLGRKTIPNLLRVIEQEGYEVPKVLIF